MARALSNTVILCLIVVIVYITVHDYYGLTLGTHSVTSLSQQHQHSTQIAPDAPTLVVASKSTDNTSWLYSESLPWQRKIYVTDDSKAPLRVPLNKGRESMVYLTYIIDHYETLSNVTLFIHSARYQWHNDDPDYDGLRNLQRLNLEHIKREGYVNLRCSWMLGCPSELRPLEDATAAQEESGKTDRRKATGMVYAKHFQTLFPGIAVPEAVGVPCCAQFAVSAEAIRRRPKSDYMRYREWIIDTDLIDDTSGRVLEYSWHIMFGKPAISCPDAKSCYCNLYGLCDLECKEQGICGDHYVLPPYSTLPEGWPYIGWDGEPRQLQSG